MTLPSSQHFFQRAIRLAASSSSGPPRQVDLRRAISDTYYGIFHATLTAAADQFVGATKRSTNQYALVYRSIDHRAIRELCLEMGKPTLPRSLTRHAPPGGFGPNLRAYSEGFLELQEKRISADVLVAVVAARIALLRFRKATDAEREAFLTLLVFKPR